MVGHVFSGLSYIGCPLSHLARNVTKNVCEQIKAAFKHLKIANLMPGIYKAKTTWFSTAIKCVTFL